MHTMPQVYRGPDIGFRYVNVLSRPSGHPGEHSAHRRCSPHGPTLIVALGKRRGKRLACRLTGTHTVSPEAGGVNGISPVIPVGTGLSKGCYGGYDKAGI